MKPINVLQKSAKDKVPEQRRIDPEFLNGLIRSRALRLDKFTDVPGVSILSEVGGKGGNFKLNGKWVFGLVFFVDEFNGKILGLSGKQMNAVEQWFRKGESDVQ
jgi:hypothetical protein